ncbi:tRNA preQ1(34) S-adenosylmethionine ribosyltransferase-isomerase QueA [Helicobacter burdigaliensis]|uniref:tRNA preQ1(34) S-adenosylmethionine ribosyltransferase-isomerase QueA n=1 Tax=Helicobacter burdigaliensis TaxID=2315334 RepID=UPI000EF733C3|nr:tRNA preQ1(34) S-adenosylmethionine ribosyltransferase-isomerase QueA [Helicobacter burdigaliensis]
MNELSLSAYDYDLPSHLIALTPLKNKEDSKLLVYNRQDKSITHSTFLEFASFLPKNTLLVFNDTKVIPARIYGKKIHSNLQEGAKIEGLFHKILGENLYLFQFRGKLKEGDRIDFYGKTCKILKNLEMGFKEVGFFKEEKALSLEEFLGFLEEFGHIPLPPYLKREDTKEDREDYQSVFAKNIGAVAAPTASLHFSKESFENLKRNFKTAFVTLHVGAGTFLPVSVENILEHKMHKESYEITKDMQKRIEEAEHITAIGTTAARTIEFYARTKQISGECDLFLHPKNPPLKTNALLTNFHLPKSTLLMLVASFVGLEEMKRIYKEAILKEYRFYSYGDGMLIL